MKKTILNGTLILFMANLIGKIFGAIYRIPLSNLLGAEGMGLYQMAFPLYSFLLTFVTLGISITLTRKIARLRSGNNVNEINIYYSMGTKLAKTFGIILTVTIILLAYPLSYLQGNTKSVFGYFVIALGFMFACKLSASRGYYQGYGKMLPTAMSQLIEQIVKLFLGLLFAYVLSGFGVVFGVMGALLGVVFGEIFATIYFKMKQRNQHVIVNYSQSRYRTFIKECFSVGINYSILPMATLIDSFLIVNLLKNSGLNLVFSTGLYGLYAGMILPLINMPNVLISAIALSCIPQISFKAANGESVGEKISEILKITFLFVLPCMIGMFALSSPILTVVYPTLSEIELNIASILLKYATVEMFFLCFLSITNSIMQALNKTKEAIKSLTIGLFVKVVIMLICLPNQNISILGATISNTVAYLIPCFMNLLVIKKQTLTRVYLKHIALPILSSIIMMAFILFSKTIFIDMSFIKLSIIICFSAIIYFSLLFFTKMWSLKDIQKLLQKE